MNNWRCLYLAIWLAATATGAQVPVKLAWDANPESNLAGYKVHYGGASRTYTNVIDVGLVTTKTLSNLLVGATYYMAATAYNDLGAESGFSLEISHTLTSPSNATPYNLRFVTNSLTSITVAWDHLSTNVFGYRVFYRLSTNAPLSNAQGVFGLQNTVSLTNLATGSNYWIMVAAVTRVGPTLVQSDFSNEIEASTQGAAQPPQPPVNLRVLTNSLQSALSVDGPWVTVASQIYEVPTNKVYRAQLDWGLK